MSEIKCLKHPKAGTHYGERTKKTRCDYCNEEVKPVEL